MKLNKVFNSNPSKPDPPLLSVPTIFFVAFFCQISAHLLLKEYMMHFVPGIASFIIISSVLGFILIIRKDTFSFILIIYICSHFSYADNQGGLWNLISFGLIFLFFMFDRFKESISATNIVIMFMMFLIISMNVVGVIANNPLPFISRLQGLATFGGFMLMFHLTRNIKISSPRFRHFIIVTLIMLLYQIIVSINQRYAIINWNTPLIGAYGADHGAITYGTTNAKGTLRNSELFGEYAVLMFTLLIPFMSSSLTQKKLNLSSKKILLMIISSLICILMTSTRSAAILVIFVVCVYYCAFVIQIVPSIDRVGRQIWMGLTVFVIIAILGSFLGKDSLKSDMDELSGNQFTLKKIASGEVINRGPLIKMAMRRIDSQSWIIGYGFSVPKGNSWAWFGRDPGKTLHNIQGFHNLYFSLPMIYGWIGMAAFLILIVYTICRLLFVTLKYRRKETFLVVTSFALTFFWCIFIIDQYKISILRNPNYHMMFWIWLGLSNAVVDTLKLEFKTGNEKT